MRTQYLAATSIDGFIADENHSLEWLYQFGGPGDSLNEFMSQVGAIAMGSHTYEFICREGKWPYQQLPAWIFTTRSLEKLDGADVQFVAGDVRPVHSQMAAQAGEKNIWIVGGGELVGQFWDHALLDEIHLAIAPVILGAGAPLLPRKIAEPPLNWISTSTDRGFLKVKYSLDYSGS